MSGHPPTLKALEALRSTADSHAHKADKHRTTAKFLRLGLEAAKRPNASGMAVGLSKWWNEMLGYAGGDRDYHGVGVALVGLVEEFGPALLEVAAQRHEKHALEQDMHERAHRESLHTWVSPEPAKDGAA